MWPNFCNAQGNKRKKNQAIDKDGQAMKVGTWLTSQWHGAAKTIDSGTERHLSTTRRGHSALTCLGVLGCLTMSG